MNGINPVEYHLNELTERKSLSAVTAYLYDENGSLIREKDGNPLGAMLGEEVGEGSRSTEHVIGSNGTQVYNKTTW